jgi:regulator of protease activity HflC (stomatin/prohibitin superfamily)
MGVLIAVVVIVVLLALLGFGLSVRIVQQYEQGVLFRLGRLRGSRAPGFHLIIPVVDVLRRVSLRVVQAAATRVPPPRSDNNGLPAPPSEAADTAR